MPRLYETPRATIKRLAQQGYSLEDIKEMYRGKVQAEWITTWYNEVKLKQ